MKVPRRRTKKSKKRSWLVTDGASGVKYEPQMMGIPEVNSSHDEEDEEMAEGSSSSDGDADGIYREACHSSDDDEDDGEDLRYLPRQRQRQDAVGSFPSFPAVMPHGDGGFPQLDALSTDGHLSTIPSGSSAASSSWSVCSSDKASASPDAHADAEKAGENLTESPTSSEQTFHEHPHTHTKPRHGCSPSMRCLKWAVTGASALLVLCMVLIIVSVLSNKGASSDLATTADKSVDRSPDSDVYQNPPTSSPSLSIATVAPTLFVDATDTSTPTGSSMTTAPTAAQQTTKAPSLSLTSAPSTAEKTASPTGTPTLLPSTLMPSTASPSVSPPCVDDATATFDINGTPRNCAWLANSTFYQTLLCNEYNYVANTLCPVSCDLCHLATGNSTTTTDNNVNP